MAQEFANVIQAMAAIAASANGGAVQPTVTWSSGFNTSATLAQGFTHTAAGVYGLVLDRPMDATNCAIFVTQRGASDATFEVVHTSAANKTVTVVVGGAASDATGFDIMVVGAPNT